MNSRSTVERFAVAPRPVRPAARISFLSRGPLSCPAATRGPCASFPATRTPLTEPADLGRSRRAPSPSKGTAVTTPQLPGGEPMAHDLTVHDIPVGDLALLPGNPRQGDIGA